MILAHVLRQCPHDLELHRERAIQDDERKRKQQARRLKQQLYAQYPNSPASAQEREARIGYLITIHNYANGAERQTIEMLT